MPKINKKFTHTRVLRTNGKIEAATIITRTSQDDVTVRTTRGGTPFRAVTTTRTRSGRTIKFLQEDSTPVNLVNNGSATTTDTTNYSIQVARVTHSFKTAPASWQGQGFVENDPLFDFFKPNALVIGQRYSLSLWIRNATNPETLTILFSAGTNTQTLSTGLMTPNNGFFYFKIENVLCTGATYLGVSVGSFSDMQVDDIWVVAGATAV